MKMGSSRNEVFSTLNFQDYLWFVIFCYKNVFFFLKFSFTVNLIQNISNIFMTNFLYLCITAGEKNPELTKDSIRLRIPADIHYRLSKNNICLCTISFVKFRIADAACFSSYACPISARMLGGQPYLSDAWSWRGWWHWRPSWQCSFPGSPPPIWGGSLKY